MRLEVIRNGLLLMLGVVLLGASACKRPEGAVVESPEVSDGGAGPTLPIQRTVIDKRGRKLKVLITGRTQTHIIITRVKDQKVFDLEIAKLSDLDRSFVAKLPISAVSSADLRFIRNRKVVLTKLEKELRSCQDDLSAENLTGSQRSNLEGKVGRLDREIRDLESQIAARR